MLRKIILAAILCMATLPALAAVPVASSGNYTGITIGTSSASVQTQYKATVFLDVYNDSASATVCCNVGNAATITGTQCAAGEITLPALWHRSWENNYLPTDTIYCISSAASTPLTIGVK